LKILHLIYTHGISGAEKYLKHLLPGLKGHGIYCDLIVVCPPAKVETLQTYCNELNVLGIKTSLISSGRLSILFTAKKISDYCKANKISILHAHLLNSDLIAVLAKSVFNKKLFLISTKHGYQEKVLQQYEPDNFYQPTDLYYKVTKFTLSKIDANFAVSKGLAQLYYNIKLCKAPYPYIHHGVAVDSFDKAAYYNECRKANPQLIIVGRIELFKGHRFLIEALDKVKTIFPNVKLLVLGEGSEKNNCVQQVNALGLQNNVEFLGFKPHPYSYIIHSDVIILPSLFEPFGLVYIEAFALKTPVVAFDTPAGNEIMQHNQTALLVKKGDSADLAENIIELLTNAGKKNSITENAYAKYKNDFTTAVMVKNTADWYIQLSL
jgi:glycosyltransferase involved in cell wall biosynthesis